MRLASISRILSGGSLLLCGHLSRRIVADTLERHSQPKLGTALRPGKDFAVSPPTSPPGLIRTFVRMLRSFVRSVSARTSLLAEDGRYPLPS